MTFFSRYHKRRLVSSHLSRGPPVPGSTSPRVHQSRGPRVPGSTSSEVRVDRFLFTARRSNASAVLAVVILSVRSSMRICLSHATRALRRNERTYCRYLNTTWQGNTLVLSQQRLAAAISWYVASFWSTVRKSERPIRKNGNFGGFPHKFFVGWYQRNVS